MLRNNATGWCPSWCHLVLHLRPDPGTTLDHRFRMHCDHDWRRFADRCVLSGSDDQ